MSSGAQRTLYSGTFIHCTSIGNLEILSETTIGVDEHGKIAFVAPCASLSDTLAKHSWDAATLKHFPSKTKDPSANITFFFPGFLDTHIHASQHPNAGIFGKTTLLSWLETYTFPLEASLSDPRKAQAVYGKCVQTTLSHGTTTAAYYATISTESTDILASTCRNLGQRAFVGRCAMDNEHFQPSYYRDADASTAISESRRSAESILAADPTGLVKPIVTPRFALSCTETSLKGLAAIAKDLSIPVQTHISENIDEIALVASHFPTHPSYTALYHNCGLLGPQTVLAHALHLTQPEIDIIKSTRTTISHCPVSNTSLGSGLCPVREYLDAGITVGLGSDVSGGYSPSILVAAREAGAVSRLRTAPTPNPAATQPRTSNSQNAPSASATPGSSRNDKLKLTVEETLYLATRGGAACLGLESVVGGFEVGKEWDALFIDLGPELDAETVLETSLASTTGNTQRDNNAISNTQIWNWMGWEERIAKWVHQGDERNVAAVWVRGRLVIDRYGMSGGRG